MNDEAFERQIEDLLLILEYADHERTNGAKHHRLPIQYFDGAEFLTKTGQQDVWFIFNPNADVCSPDIVWPVDYSVVTAEENPKVDDFRYLFRRVRTIRPSEARGRARLIGRYMVEISFAGIGDLRAADLQTHVSVRGYASYLGGKWTAATGTSGDSHHTAFDPTVSHAKGLKRPPRENLSSITNALMHCAFAYRSWWHVKIRIGDGPALRLATMPEGAREIFKLRDVPSGKKRREALRNWVREHWRRNREGESSINVLKHLRGACSFSWNGLSCEIEPSADAIEEAERIYLLKWGEDQQRRPSMAS